jgi:rubredoxin
MNNYELSPRTCPKCGAKPNQPCRTKTGREATLHCARWHCPKCGVGRVDLKCWSCDWAYKSISGESDHE